MMMMRCFIYQYSIIFFVSDFLLLLLLLLPLLLPFLAFNILYVLYCTVSVYTPVQFSYYILDFDCARKKVLYKNTGAYIHRSIGIYMYIHVYDMMVMGISA